MIKRLAIHWVISTLGLMLLPVVFGAGVEIDDWKTAAIAAVVVGIVNISIGPILKLVTLPIRWLTLGFFTLLINAVLLLIVAKVVPGFTIDRFWTAFWAALVYSIVTWVAGMIFVPDED